MSAADQLYDQLNDLLATETMCKRSTGWQLGVSTVRGGFEVTIRVDDALVVKVHDSWLDRGIRTATGEFEAWREQADRVRLNEQLQASVEVSS